MKPDPMWHQEQVVRYTRELSNFEVYAETLRSVLQRACATLAPQAIVQTRPKALSSFAEKAARKADKYSDPVRQLTDLCGGRIVTTTQAETDAICEFIKTHFVVDWPNSVDKRAELKTDQFGYLSVHYVVQLRAPRILDVNVPLEQIGDRKAEIQVRTLIQHAWSEVTHDRLYKSALVYPEVLRREGHRLAAASEELDRDLATLLAEMDHCAGSCTASLKPEAVKDELELLKLILSSEPDASARTGHALRLAQLAQSLGDYATAIDVLSPLVQNSNTQRAGILLEMGRALTSLHKTKPNGRAFQNGLAYIKGAAGLAIGKAKTQCVITQNETRSEALSLLANLLRNRPGHAKQSRIWMRQAYWLSPHDPFRLLAFVASEIRETGNLDAVYALRPHLQTAITTCVRHLGMGSEPVRGWFALARLHLLLEQDGECLAACFKGIEQCRLTSANARGCLNNELEFLKQIEVTPKWALHEKMRAVVELAIAALKPQTARSGRAQNACTPMLILAGDAGMRHAPESSNFQWKTVLAKFEGRVLRPRSAALIKEWQKIIATGNKPEQVKILMFNGNENTALSSQLGLALGATVGVVIGSGEAADALLRNKVWSTCLNLLALPADAMTLRAFVNSSCSALDNTLLEAMGRAVHANYVERNKSRTLDPSLVPWNELQEDLKQSNRQQAAQAEMILRAAGFEVQPVPGQVRMPEFTQSEIEFMAELEHGRWNVERLRSGWKLGARKDVAKKVSPHIRPWTELSEPIRDYDRQAVLGYPKLLALAGLEVRRKMIHA